MKEIDKAYLDISQGGISFAVVDDGHGPTIQITMTNMGHQQKTEIHTDADALAAIGEMFIEASKHKGYSAPYCEAARFMDSNFRRIIRSVCRLRDEGKNAEADALMFTEASMLRDTAETNGTGNATSEDPISVPTDGTDI